MNSREAFELMHNYYRIVDPTVRKRLFQLVRTLAFSEAADGGGERPETPALDEV